MFPQYSQNTFKLLFTMLLAGGFFTNAQNKYEREFRILKKQFPEKALHYLSGKIDDARRVRYYKEIDSLKNSYEVKLKKDKLHYSIEFSEEGILEDVEVTIKPVDIPDESWQNIQHYLSRTFRKSKIRKIQQQYPVTEKNSPEIILKNAFQNLLLPYLNYELIVAGKKDGAYEQYEILFNADGHFKKKRKSLPPNYDHVLY